MTLELRSPAFEQGEMIPPRYTCDGEDVSPPLSWSGVPNGARSLALILEDVDSVKGVWSHWVVYNMSPSARTLEAGISPGETPPGGGIEGVNDFGDIGYGGPCPSDGSTHRYVVHLYALDRAAALTPGATRDEVLEVIKEYVIDEAKLMGRYRRLADR